MRSKDGRNKIYESSSDLKEAIRSYIESVNETTPLTIRGCAEYLGVSYGYFTSPDSSISSIKTWAKDIFFEKNFSLYEKGLVPINLISKELSRKGIKITNQKRNYTIKPGYVPGVRESKDVGKPMFDGTVYFIKALGTDMYKIGFSTNLKRRLRDINAGLPFKIKLLGVKRELYAADTESRLHEMYSDYALKNEWYRFDESKAKEVLKHFKSK